MAAWACLLGERTEVFKVNPLAFLQAGHHLGQHRVQDRGRVHLGKEELFGYRPGQRGLYIHVPVGPDQLVEFLLAGGDALFHLPDQVAHEPGHVDRVGRAGTCGLEVLYEPVFVLVVDQLVVMADAGFPEAFLK